MVCFMFQNKQKEPAYGVDVLRLWAARYDLQSVVEIGSETLNKCNNDVFEVNITP